MIFKSTTNLSFHWFKSILNKPEVSLRNPKLPEISFEPGLRPHNAPIGREQIHHISVNLDDKAEENQGRAVKVLMHTPPQFCECRSWKAKHREASRLALHTCTLDSQDKTRWCFWYLHPSKVKPSLMKVISLGMKSSIMRRRPYWLPFCELCIGSLCIERTSHRQHLWQVFQKCTWHWN